ncbi:hypothetical protein HY469_06045, partial [Candidatus Roizmanbacteria bacterium]|nr:hypothetical protein [Candidatus Roizmanbacteria bacterium]
MNRRENLFFLGKAMLAGSLLTAGCQAEAPPGEPLVSGDIPLNISELQQFHENAKLDKRDIDIHDPQVVRYINSVVYHSILSNGVDPETAYARSQKISVDLQESHPNSCLGSACAYRFGEIQLTGHYVNNAEDWDILLFLLSHEGGHQATEPPQELSLVGRVEDYGFSQYQIWSPDGFTSVSKARLGNTPELLYKQHTFPMDKMGEVCIPEELYAELSAVHASNYMQFTLSASEAPYGYAFAESGILASLPGETTEEAYF